MGAKFLCCLPLKLGVYTIATFQLIFNGLAATFFWFLLKLALEVNPGSGPIAAVVIYAVTFTLGSLLSIVGLVGVIRKNIPLIRVLLRLMIYMAIFWAWFSMTNMISISTSTVNSDFVECMSEGENDPTLTDQCTAYATALHDPRIITLFVIMTVILPVALQLYGFYIVRAFYQKLRRTKSLEASISNDVKRQSWTIDGPDIEPPDWKTISRTASQLVLTKDDLQQQHDSELIPLTAGVGSAPSDVELGSGMNAKGKQAITEEPRYAPLV